MTVDCTVRGHRGLLVAGLSGQLGLSDVGPLRLRLSTCLAEQPRALLLDLSGLAVVEPKTLALFTVVARQASLWPGSPVLLCGASTETDALLSVAVRRRLPRFPSVETAADHVERGGHAMPTIAEELLPVRGAASHGRNVATDACLRWEVPDLVPAASLICSELISNVVDHAHTMMTLRLSLSDRYLFIAVRDGSPVEPAAPPAGRFTHRGRGLRIVDATAHGWGCLPTDDGKVVWASLLVRS